MPALVNCLADKQDGVRRGACYVLGEIGAGARPAVPALTKALKDDSDAVRQAAAAALKKIPPKE